MPPEIFVYLALLCYVLGFLAHGDLVLRALILLGSTFYILYYYLVADAPLWEAIIGTFAIILANIYSAVRILRERSTWGMSAEGIRTYTAFNTLKPGEFRQLMRFVKTLSFDQDTPLFEQGDRITKIYFIQSGVVQIKRGGRISEMGSGNFIGELAFLRHTTASAGVSVKKGAVLLELKCEDIQFLMTKPSFSNAILKLFNRHLAARLSVSWPDHETIEEPERDRIALVAVHD